MIRARVVSAVVFFLATLQISEVQSQTLDKVELVLAKCTVELAGMVSACEQSQKQTTSECVATMPNFKPMDWWRSRDVLRGTASAGCSRKRRIV